MSQPLPPILNPDDPLRPYSPPPKPKKNRWLKMRRALHIGGVIIAITFSLLVLVAAVMEKKIGTIVVREANAQLNTQLSVGDFSLSLISGFPKATAWLKNVGLKDAFGGTLVRAESVAFQVGFFSLFKKNIEIEAIIIENGILSLKTDARGRTNFDIVKKTNTSNGKDAALLIEKAQLKNVRVHYTDLPNDIKAEVFISKARLKGNFGAEQFFLDANAQSDVVFFEKNKHKLLESKPLSIAGDIAVDLSKKMYSFKKLTADVAHNPLILRGLIQLVAQKGTFFNLEATSNGGNLAHLFQLLPPQYAARFSAFKSKGAFSFDTQVKGLLSRTQSPEVKASVQLKNGELTNAMLEEPVKNILLDANFDSKKSSIAVQNCQATFLKHNLSLKALVTNLKNPSLSLSANGALPFAFAVNFLKLGNKKISDAGGILFFKNLKIEGKTAQLSLNKAQASGQLTFDKTHCQLDNTALRADGNLNFDNQKIDFQSFTLKGLESDVRLTGSLTNWLALLASDDAPQADALLDAQAQIENLDLGKILAFTAPEPQATPSAYGYATKGLPMPAYRKKVPFLNHLSGQLETTVGQFKYNKITGRAFKGTLNLTGNDLILRGSTNAMQGGWLVDGKMNLGYRPHLFAKLTTSGVNITELFNQCDNFGQATLRKENIAGRLNSRVAINAFWDENFNFDLNRLHVLADVSLLNGELVGLKLLEKFSTYVKIKDLQHVKFTNLNNQLEIYRRTVNIPLMFIQTNALNLQMSGSHTFDHKIDYNLALNAGQVLMNRFKLFNNRLDPQPDRRNGWFTLYYAIGGTAQNPNFAQDKNGVKNAFANSETQLNDIRARLSQAFNIRFNAPNGATDNVAQQPQVPQIPTRRPLPRVPNNDDDTEYLPGF